MNKNIDIAIVNYLKEFQNINNIINLWKIKHSLNNIIRACNKFGRYNDINDLNNQFNDKLQYLLIKENNFDL